MRLYKFCGPFVSLVLHDNQDGDDDNGLMQRNGPDRTVKTVAFIAGKKNPADQKFYIRFSIENLV